ncbi:type II secretion system protein D [Verrucomicrobium sp. GAS474]|uniref:secretin N-terminal domain-containing protein n=1 Tax=Verrucomicrobium sp. GAS474 TaxID=1882831 RepID=UPI00087C0DBE|nr:secretin N-terminal domain-containing protein [Verrucomicrobium sp. GAS474]SDT94288.1 type II secretion system protein D [Verrucomicrobium sp. GAS474]
MKRSFPGLGLAGALVALFLAPALAPGASASPEREGPAWKAQDEGAVVDIQLPNAPINDILSTYEALTGKTLVRDANLSGPNLTITSGRKLTKGQAIRLIESALLLNGYALVPGTDGTVKVVNGGGGKSPRSEGIPVLASASDLPEGDQVVSLYLPLRFVTPADASAILQAHLTPHSYGAIVQVAGAQALVVTESSPVLREILKLKDLIDVPPIEIPPPKLTKEFVPLRRADAEKVADTLNKLLEAQKKAASAAGSPPAQGQPNAGLHGGNLLVLGDVQLVADGRTNRILVITRPANFPLIKELIEQFDQSVEIEAPYIRSLKYVSALDVLTVLQRFLVESKDEVSGIAEAGGKAAGAKPVPGPASRPGSSPTGMQERLDEQADEQPPQEITVGKTRLIADNKTNTLLVFGPPDSVSRARTIIDNLDIRPRQVYLATVVGKLSLTNSSELSVDLLQNFHSLSGNVGAAASSQNSTLAARSDPRSLAAALAFPAGTGLAFYGAVGNTLNAYVKALESTGRFTILSRPSVYTANNKKASISSGQQVPIPQSTLSSLDSATANNVAQSSTIEYKDVELLLEVIPLINSEREVTLRISQQNSTISGSSTISGNTVPIISKDALETTVTTPNRSTVILGGLIKDSDQASRSGVPLLKDIPFLGALFRSDTKNRERDELVILIQPTVVETDEDLARAQAEEKSRATLGEAAERYAAKPASAVTGKSTALESLTH